MQSKNKNFVNNTITLFIGKISTRLIQFLLLPLYTSILSTSEYGVVDLISTYVTILVVLVNMQIENAIFRFLTEKRGNKNEQTKIITNIFCISIVQIVFYTIIYIFAQFFITIEAKIFLLLNVISSIFFSTMLQITRGMGDYKTYAKASFLSSFLTIILNIIFLIVFKMSITGLLLSSFISYLISGVYLLIKKKIIQYINFKYFNKSKSKELLSYSLPLIPNELSWQAIKSSDKIIISNIMGISSTGILSVSMKFSNAFTEVYNIFNTSLTDSVISNINDEEGQIFINELINRLYRIFLSLDLLIIAVMPFVFNIFINSSYYDSYNYIPLYMVSCLINVMIGITSGIFVAKKNTKIIAYTSTLAGIINIIVDLLLVRKIGIYAAALSTILGFLVMFIIRYCIIVKTSNLRIQKSNFFLTLISVVIVLFSYYFFNKLIKIIILVLTILFSIYLNKDLIFNKQIISKYIKRNKKKVKKK